VSATLASLIDVEHLVKVAGYPLLVLIVMGESSGVPLPGETALITAAVLASGGKLKIELVIPLAAAGAIIGDNLGYAFARKGGRWLLERPGRFQRQRKEILVIGEPFFERHGPKAVFFGRFILGLRTWASWLAGATRMPWRSFVLWNALGGICWATTVGLIAYFLGHSAKNALETFGVYGLVAALLAIVSALVLGRRYHGRATRARTHERALARARSSDEDDHSDDRRDVDESADAGNGA
jgi:membrane-associated protein